MYINLFNMKNILIALFLCFSLSTVQSQNICNGGTATADPQESNPTGCSNPTYIWSNGATSSTISVGAGTYSVTITYDGCDCSDEGTFTVTECSAIVGNPSEVNQNTDCSNCNGVGQVAPTGGCGPYAYLWPASAGSATTAQASGLCSGSYDVTVTDTGVDCGMPSVCEYVFTVVITDNISPTTIPILCN